eukprot:1270222-Amorphochlora_amoeboformis.AAC.1
MAPGFQLGRHFAPMPGVSRYSRGFPGILIKSTGKSAGISFIPGELHGDNPHSISDSENGVNVST